MINIYDKLAYVGYVLMIIFYSNQIYELYNSNPIYYSLIFGSLLYIFSMLLYIYDKYRSTSYSTSSFIYIHMCVCVCMYI